MFRLAATVPSSGSAEDCACDAPGTVRVGSGEVDATPPSVAATNPADLAVGVDRDAPVTITFSEPMNPSSFAGCFRIVPTPGAVTASWTPDGRQVTLDHPTLWPGVTYTVAVCAAATDASDPGLALGGYVFTFTTLPIPNTPPTVAVIVDAPANPSPGGWVTITWNASDAEDPRLDALVEFAASGEPFTAILTGSYPTGGQQTAWTVPAVDGPVEVRVCVTDSMAAA
ncbi:MAG TPA: Ig-like domain-containing protein, partial [Thermoplasmata archaeon]|nr:Ig-like domain-containing protein [Thermoplasmata archaeon]